MQSGSISDEENSSRKGKTPKKSLLDSKKQKNNKNNSKQGTLDLFNIKIPEKEDEKVFPQLKNGEILNIYSYNINGVRAFINKGSFDVFMKAGNIIKVNCRKP